MINKMEFSDPRKGQLEARGFSDRDNYVEVTKVKRFKSNGGEEGVEFMVGFG